MNHPHPIFKMTRTLIIPMSLPFTSETNTLLYEDKIQIEHIEKIFGIRYKTIEKNYPLLIIECGKYLNSRAIRLNLLPNDNLQLDLTIASITQAELDGFIQELQKKCPNLKLDVEMKNKEINIFQSGLFWGLALIGAFLILIAFLGRILSSK